MQVWHARAGFPEGDVRGFMLHAVMAKRPWPWPGLTLHSLPLQRGCLALSQPTRQPPASLSNRQCCAREVHLQLGLVHPAACGCWDAKCQRVPPAAWRRVQDGSIAPHVNGHRGGVAGADGQGGGCH